MSALLKLKQRKSAKQAEAQRMIDAIANGAEHRDMNPEEKTKFDGLTAEIATLKGQIASAKALDDEEEADEVETAAEPRSVRRSAQIDDAPAVHAGARRYSYHRALLGACEGNLDGLEGEISREIAIRTNVKPKGFYMPTGQDHALHDLAQGLKPGTTALRRELTYLYGEQRALDTSTGAGSIFTVPEGTLIELLRAKLVIKQLGARMLTNMKGLFAIPRQSGKGTVYWVTQGGAATLGNPTLDQVAFSPKVAIAATNISRLFMAETSLDAEQFTKEDLAESMAREFDRVSINGITGNNEPGGLLQNGTIQSQSSGLAIGPSGGSASWATIVGLESTIAALNADAGKLAYLTNPTLRGVLKQTPKIGNTYPDFIWQNTPTPGVGEMNGYPAWATTNVPGNLTKGSGASLSALIFGDWSQMVCAMWEGVDVVVNPYTNQLQGAVIVSTAMSMDVQVRHAESFAFVTDAH